MCGSMFVIVRVYYYGPDRSFWQTLAYHAADDSAKALKEVSTNLRQMKKGAQLVQWPMKPLVHITIHCMQHSETHCSTLQRRVCNRDTAASHCNALQQTATHSNLAHCKTLQYAATHYNTHCNTLKYTATQYNTQYGCAGPVTLSPVRCPHESLCGIVER